MVSTAQQDVWQFLHLYAAGPSGHMKQLKVKTENDAEQKNNT
jgi:hypothetical protein